jgi:hypothetical protein
VQPKEFMVAKKNKNIPPKEVPRKMAKMVPKEGVEIKHQSVSRYIGGTCQQFQRTCILGGKVAKLIIDPRSGMNIVSEEAVRKLGLETKSHPSPYQLEWLTKGNEVRVSKYCQVPFSIGAKYMDHVWCDVVDMTMCHLLLGKPWQDDKTAVYNETKNTYSFLLGKTKLTLLQSPWPEPQPSQGNIEFVDEERQEFEVIDEEFERECVEDVDPSQGFVDWNSPPTYDEDINEKDPIEEPLTFALEEEHEELGKQVDEVNLSESFALFDDNSTYYVHVKSLEGKVFDFSVEPIDYVDFIGIDAILSNYSSQNCDEIYMVEEAFLSKIERVFVSSLGIRMACRKSKAREKHNKSTQKRGMWGFHNNHQDTPLMKITMIIMGRGLAVKLRRDDWNELTGHPKDRGRDRPNSRTNSLQPGEDDVD